MKNGRYPDCMQSCPRFGLGCEQKVLRFVDELEWNIINIPDYELFSLRGTESSGSHTQDKARVLNKREALQVFPRNK